MMYKVKKFFSPLLKKKILFPVLSFVLFGIFLLPQSVSAAWYDFLIGAVTFIPNVGLSIIIYILIVLTGLLAAFGGAMLSWVTGPNFTSLSYTNPATNEIIETGLSITQGFVNMILVLILVYIAIATILRLAGHETKKLLVTFIIVALLVNFAPVICGLIVDASNIIMNFFIKETTGSKQLINSLSSISATAQSAFGSWEVFKISKQMDLVFNLVSIAVVNLFLFLALFLFTFIFIVRYIAIWILVILSPLAFACYILPATKKYWELWWNQLLQWSFIGVTCGFFLYLSERFASLGPGAFGPVSGLGSNILPHAVPIVFLFMGLIFGLRTSAMGASGLMSIIKTSGKKTGKWVGGRVWRGVKPHIEDKLRTKEAATRITKAVEKTPGVRWFLPETFRHYAEYRPTIDAEKARVSPLSSRAIAHRIASGADFGVRATGGMMELIARGDMQDLIKSYLKKYKKKTGKENLTEEELFENSGFKKEMSRPIQIAFQSGYQSTLLRGDPRLARISAGKKWAGPVYERMTDPEEAVRTRTREARRTHVNNWEREVVEDKTVVSTLMERGREVFESIDVQVKMGQDTTLKTIDKLFTSYLEKQHPKLNSKELEQKFGDQSSKATKAAWEAFRQDFKTNPKLKHNGKDGYFVALDSKRFTDRGWRQGRYIAPDKEERSSAEAGFEAATGGPTPSPKIRKEKKKGPPETGAGL